MSEREISVLTLQRGLRHLGHDPGPLDGIFGDRTGGALSAWLQSLPATSGLTVMSPADGSRYITLPNGLATMLEEAARAFQARQGSSSTPATRSPAPLAPLTSATFWRRNNPWAWAIAALGVGVLSGGVYWFGRKRRWFR